MAADRFGNPEKPGARIEQATRRMSTIMDFIRIFIFHSFVTYADDISHNTMDRALNSIALGFRTFLCL